jgi:hypothetical protein
MTQHAPLPTSLAKELYFPLQEFVALYGRMVVLFEDLQYFDSASCRLLSALTAALPSDVLVIATYRPSSSHVAAAESDSRHGGGAASSSASNFPAVLQAR